MAAKLLHSLADDNPDLQKQIGCMTGIFQVFDRQHMVTTRRITGPGVKKLPPGGSHISGGSSQIEPNRFAAAGNYLGKNLQEKRRVSTESSRASFSSSSRSSSFSSLDCNRAPQPETSSFDRIIFPETPSKEPGIIQPNASPEIGEQILDLRDMVKDSIHKEAHSLSVKAATKEEAADSLEKPRYSPRPIQLLKTDDDGSYALGPAGNQDLNVDLKESVQVLAKLRDAPWYFNEHRELSRSSSYNARDGSSFLLSKDAPRFSYDGREIRRSSFESQSRESFKSALKHKDLPRLSLDSRENSMRSFNYEPKSSSHLKTLQKESSNFNDKVSNLDQAPGIQKRPPSVVAKLMGLETLPDSGPTTDSRTGLGKTSPEEDAAPFSRSSEATDLCKPIRISDTSKNLWKEPNSPRWKNHDSVMKPISRFPIEPAPWRQLDSTRSSQKPASRNMKAPGKNSGPFPSVYSEIEKRLKDLEFSESGKDLRALKQILEAIQAKVLLETQKECQDSNFMVNRDHERKFTSSTQITKLTNQRNTKHGQGNTSMWRGPSSLRNFEAPIVIMKPAKLVEKSGFPSSSSVVSLDSLPSLPRLQDGDLTDSRKGRRNSWTAKDQSTKIIRGGEGGIHSNVVKGNKKALKSTLIVTRSQQISKENSMTSVKNSGSISPRMQHKKPEMEKQSRPPTPPPDFSRSRRQSSRQQMESSSPGGRRRSKYSNPQPASAHLSEGSNESMDLNSEEREISVELDGNINLDSKVDIEVTSSEKSLEISSTPTRSAGQNSVSSLAGKKSTMMLSEDVSMGEVAIESPEYPSPISVLDSRLNNEDSTSPLKQISKALEGDKSQDSDNFSSTLQFSSADDVTPKSYGSGLTSDISRKKLQNIENLVQKLRRLNSTHDEARTDYIASLCENTNPDHRYISEVLLASGLLLKDLGSSLTAFQFHSSGHPLNPELFLVLEQTKASTLAKEDCRTEKLAKEKFHRKLIFDAVNEILAWKLVSVGPPSDPWLRPRKLARKTLNAQKLLRELCLEIEQLKSRRPECSLEDEDDGLKNILWEDVINHSESWTDFSNELSGVVLDVERLIFKDLVDEVVIGESTGLRIRPARRRQLFRK